MRALLALALLAALAWPVVAAQTPSADPVTFLTYRPWPDPRAASADADPHASALAPPPREVDRLPFTLVDRATRADLAPENAPGSALAHYRELARLVQEREAQGAPLTLTLRGSLAPGALVVEATPTAATTLTLVVLEHGAAPYQARFVLAPVEVGANETSRQEVRLDPSWDPSRLGVVAIAENERGVQSATWLVRDDVPTVQTRKAVLIEHVTATWCDPCGPVDEALALLQAQRGVAGAADAPEAPSYLRAPGLPLFAGAALGLAGAWALLRRSR